MDQDASNEAIVRALYGAYHSRQWDAFRVLLADAFTFTSPYDNAIDIEAYRKRCWPPGDDQTKFRIERVTEDRDGAFITYFVTAKNERSFRNTEYLEIAGGKVKSVAVYFGPGYCDGNFVAKKPA